MKSEPKEYISVTPPEWTDWSAMPYMPPMAEWADSPTTKTRGLRPAGMSDFDSESDNHEWDSPEDEENDLETADNQIIDDFLL
jgi:hypothetical protein